MSEDERNEMKKVGTVWVQHSKYDLRASSFFGTLLLRELNKEFLNKIPFEIQPLGFMQTQ